MTYQCPACKTKFGPDTTLVLSDLGPVCNKCGIVVVDMYGPVYMTRTFNTGATRDQDSAKLDFEGFISPLVLRAYAEYMHKCRLRNIPAGDTIRASDNWQKGMPSESYAKSMIRHVVEAWLILDGFEARDEKGNVLDLEKVLCAIMFNVMGLLYERLKLSSNRAQ